MVHHPMIRSERVGPVLVQESDILCILQGAKVPFIIRKAQAGKYVLVGEAFVYDLMEEEVPKLDIGRQLQEIILV